MFATLLQWLINAWVLSTGRRVNAQQNAWANGPVSRHGVVGDDFYKKYAKEADLVINRKYDGGLLDDFSQALDSHDRNLHLLNPRIAHFYEHTSSYRLEVWSQWSGPVQYFARILIAGLSRKIKQLNIPLEPLETSYGMSSDIISLQNHAGQTVSTCWLRKSVKTDNVVYAGFYSSCWLPKLQRNGVKVVFPLPKGNVTVLLKVEVQPDGSVKLLSHGKGLGDAGYYRIRHIKEQWVKTKYVPLKEIIHVFEDDQGILRTDHEFYFWGSKFLQLHYKIIEP